MRPLPPPLPIIAPPISIPISVTVTPISIIDAAVVAAAAAAAASHSIAIALTMVPPVRPSVLHVCRILPAGRGICLCLPGACTIALRRPVAAAKSKHAHPAFDAAAAAITATSHQ